MGDHTGHGVGILVEDDLPEALYEELDHVDVLALATQPPAAGRRVEGDERRPGTASCCCACHRAG